MLPLLVTDVKLEKLIPLSTVIIPALEFVNVDVPLTMPLKLMAEPGSALIWFVFSKLVRLVTTSGPSHLKPMRRKCGKASLGEASRALLSPGFYDQGRR